MARRISIFVLFVVLLANLCMSILIGINLLHRTVDYVDSEGTEATQTGARLFEYVIDNAIRNGIFSEEDFFVTGARKEGGDVQPVPLKYKLYLSRNLQRNVEAMLKSGPIYYACGLNHAGDLVAHSDPNRQADTASFRREHALSPPTENADGKKRWRDTDGLEYYDYVQPIYVRDRLWGAFHAGIPVNYIGQRVWVEAVRLILYSVMVAVLCAWLVYLAVKHWLYPLQALIEDAKRLAGGDMAVMSPYGNKHDEVGMLARAFNGMATTIRITMNYLESQVKERTAGLNTLIDNSPAGLLLVDEKEKVIVRVNQATAILLNETQDSLAGRSCQELFGEQKSLMTLIDSADSTSTEVILQSRRGTCSQVLARQVHITMDGTDYRLIILLDITDQKKAWRALEETEQRYRQLIMQLHTAIVAIGTDHRVQIINQSAMKLLHVSVGVIGKRYDQVDWGEVKSREEGMEQDQVKDLVRSVIRGHMPIFNRLIELRAHQPGETMRYWALAGAVPLYGEDGDMAQIILSLNDVSELKQMQEDYRILSEKRSELESIIEHSDMTVLLIQLHPVRLEYISSNVMQYGYSPDDFGKNAWLILRMVAHEDRPLVVGLVQKLRDGHCGFERLIFRIESREGLQRWVEAGLWARESEGRGVTHIQAIFTNITERKMLEDEVSRAYAVIQNSPDPICFLDARRHVTYVNTACRKMFHLTAGKIDQTELRAMLEQHVIGMMVERVEQNGTGESSEATISLADGTQCQVLARVISLFGETPDQSGIGVVISDLTAQKEAERERKLLETRYFQSQKLESIGQLAAGIAHEINTPSQFVGDNLRFLQDAFRDVAQLQQAYRNCTEAHAGSLPESAALKDLENDLDVAYLLEETPKAIGQSLDGIQRISDIVRAMKEFSHPGSGEMQPVDLNHAIRNTVAVARNEWKYFAEMVLTLDEKMPPVPCQAGEFNQVMLNLIVNSAHAIKEVLGIEGQGKGTIEITTRVLDGQWAEVIVRDTGTGIPEEIGTRVFDPFFTTKGVGLGTGQGLAIVYDVIKNRHHGDVFFETEIGKGTAFHVRLPLIQTAPDGEQPHGK